MLCLSLFFHCLNLVLRILQLLHILSYLALEFVVLVVHGVLFGVILGKVKRALRLNTQKIRDVVV